MTQPVAVEIDLVPAEGSFPTSHRYYIREVGTEGWSPVASSDQARIRIEGMPRTGRYEIGIAPVVDGIEADESAWTIEPWESGLSDFNPPGPVTGFDGQQSGAMILLRWDPVEIAFLDRYEVRLGASWDDGIPVDKVRAPATSTMVGAWYTGAHVFWIAAWSVQGLRSEIPASVTVDVQGDDYAPVQATVDESGGGFAATKADTEVDAGNLRIAALPTASSGWSAASSTYTQASYLPHRGTGTYTTTWVDVGAVVRERVEVGLAVAHDSASIASELYAQPDREEGETSGPGDYLDAAAYDLRGMQVRVEIDTAQDGVPTSDGWRGWVPGGTYKYRQVRLRFTLTSISPRNLKITSLSWRRRRLNRKDEVTATVSGTGGTAVTWTTSFTGAPKVSAQYIGTAGRWATVDSVTASGCNVRIYEHDGTEVGSGTVHVVAMGV